MEKKKKKKEKWAQKMIQENRTVKIIKDIWFSKLFREFIYIPIAMFNFD